MAGDKGQLAEPGRRVPYLQINGSLSDDLLDVRGEDVEECRWLTDAYHVAVRLGCEPDEVPEGYGRDWKRIRRAAVSMRAKAINKVNQKAAKEADGEGAR